MAKKNKKKKEKHIVGTKELIFDIVSVLAIVSLGIYFGYRSIKYYTKETSKNKVEENTLVRAITNNNKVTKGENGLRQTEDGYYFIGSVENNYLKAFNRLYRIIEINNNNEIKIVSNNNEAVFVYGNENDYKTSNIYSWLNKEEGTYGVYYDSIPGVENLLTKTSYKIDTLDGNKVKDNKSKKYSNYFSILSASDYIRALGKKSYLNSGNYSFLLGNDEGGNPLYILEDGSIDSASNYDGYGIRVVMTLKKNALITGGSGTMDDPYVLNQEGNENKVNSYLKLGEDVYQVVSENETLLKLKKNDYLAINGTYAELSFSNKDSMFNLKDRNNIGYYLNNTYLNSLSYANILSEGTYYIGEISTDTSYSIGEIFNDSVSARVGLLNTFDLNTDITLTDYYLVNKTSSVGNMIWTYNRLGILDDEKGTEKKKVVPVINIDKNLIKNGDGSINNPYVLE